MRLSIFSTRRYERQRLERCNEAFGHELNFIESRLTAKSAALAKGSAAVSIFANDDGSAASLEALAACGVELLALRTAGFNHVDVAAAERLDLTLLRVPSYSPHAIAEHTVGMMLTLNRKFHRSFNRIREQNFSLDGLLGFNMRGKCAGIVGTGQIGSVVCQILQGFGCRVLGYDAKPNADCLASGVRYVSLEELYAASDIISLHCPLTPETHHLIDANGLAQMKRGTMLINTSRGAVIDTQAVIGALKQGQLGALGIDVYEEEADLFFKDLSGRVIQDDIFARLMTFPNVLITAHQAFFTEEALAAIHTTTLRNVRDYERSDINDANRVTSALVTRQNGSAARSPVADA